MKANLNQIESFLTNRKIALVGVSRTKSKFGNEVFKQLLGKGYEVVPVHRVMTEFEGHACFGSIESLPDDVSAICLVVPKTETDALLQAALNRGIRQIWVQQMSETSFTNQLAAQSGANIVLGRCIFMYTSPEGFHRFHQRLSKIFGTYAH